MKLDLFDYELPEKSIAQYPSAERGASRLLVMHRDGGVTEDRSFSDLPEYIREGDLLVFNDSKVVKARLIGEKRGTGARIELFLLSGAALTGQGAKANGSLACECLAKPARRLKAGDEVIFGKNLSASVKARMEDGSVLVEFRFDGAFLDKLEELGHVPLPPYIKRPDEKCDEDRYQTVYAAAPGSAAAPTAGLHFTEELMERLEEKGAMAAFVTLHVGLGTFRPV
ncbi:MAG: S-adenosylmethionine:tRNA ribosyltransferase-isomerase, partial [Clostridiales Family XIII bacterium]|nr:S-adenosylmethionine:tRNA ribosyltransferase-isomerase [Clostridiales Family XIII bacterium]